MNIQLEPKDWVAIYAAVVATGGIIWNLVSWRLSRPKIHVEVQLNGAHLQLYKFGDHDNYIIKKFIPLEIEFLLRCYNHRTTIHRLVIRHIPLWWPFQRAYTQEIEPHIVSLPKEIEAGGVWKASFRETDIQMAGDKLHLGKTYLDFYDTWHRKRKPVRLPIKRKMLAFVRPREEREVDERSIYQLVNGELILNQEAMNQRDRR